MSPHIFSIIKGTGATILQEKSTTNNECENLSQ